MDFLQAIFLGIIQGLTEFLPVSSSGHLVIFQNLLGVQGDSLVFDVAVHLGTLASVLTVYFKFIQASLVKASKSFTQKKLNNEAKLVLLVIAATLPTAVIGLVLKDTFESLFSNLAGVGFCLMITGTLLLLTKGKGKASQNQNFFNFIVDDLTQFTYLKAVLIGLAQSIAIAPGISRSGTTIAVGILLGLPRHLAAMFSFMLAIPAILGAGILQLKHASHLSSQDLSIMGIGFVAAYFSGLLGLYGVLHIVKRGRLEFFTVYLWVLGAVSMYFALK